MKSFHMIKDTIDRSPGNLWLEEIRIEKDEFLTKRGTIEKKLYFVKQGSLRVYFDDKDQEHTIRLGYRNSFISSLDSFINETPSLFNIQAIKTCILQQIDRATFLQFIDTHQLEDLWIRALSELIGQQMLREIDLLTKTPLERYDRLLERSPWVFQEVPHKYIASYLRMTPETLSRLLKS